MSDLSLFDPPKGPIVGTFRPYIIGFILSIMLTLAAYFLVAHNLLQGWNLIFSIVGMAIAQALVQLLLFIHLNHEAWPKYNLLAFVSMLMIFLIIMGGTLWIMWSLDERTMPSAEEMNKYMLEQSGIKK